MKHNAPDRKKPNAPVDAATASSTRSALEADTKRDGGKLASSKCPHLNTISVRYYQKLTGSKKREVALWQFNGVLQRHRFYL